MMARGKCEVRSAKDERRRSGDGSSPLIALASRLSHFHSARPSAFAKVTADKLATFFRTVSQTPTHDATESHNIKILTPTSLL